MIQQWFDTWHCITPHSLISSFVLTKDLHPRLGSLTPSHSLALHLHLVSQSKPNPCLTIHAILPSSSQALLVSTISLHLKSSSSFDQYRIYYSSFNCQSIHVRPTHMHLTNHVDLSLFIYIFHFDQLCHSIRTSWYKL